MVKNNDNQVFSFISQYDVDRDVSIACCWSSSSSGDKVNGLRITFLAGCSAVIGWFSAAVIGTFQTLMLWFVVPSAVCCYTALLLLCFLL